MTGFIAFLFVVFLMLSGKYIVIGLFMLIFRILLTIYSIIAEYPCGNIHSLQTILTLFGKGRSP